LNSPKAEDIIRQIVKFRSLAIAVDDAHSHQSLLLHTYGY